MYHIQHEIILRTQGDRMRDKENTKALWTRPFLFLIIVSLLTTMGFNMVYVMISNYAMAINGSLAIGLRNYTVGNREAKFTKDVF